MAVKFTHTEDGTFFCTFTCLRWLHLFEITDLYSEIYKWLNILISKRHQIAGFVIMPNHLHVLIHLNGNAETINQILANGKRFMAYEIVRRLQLLQREDLLTILKIRYQFLNASAKNSIVCLKCHQISKSAILKSF